MRLFEFLCFRILRLVLLFLSVLWVEQVVASRIAGISRAEADSLGRQTVIYNGVPVTFNTLSRDLLKKVSGATSYRGLSAEQVIVSLRLFPLEWKDQPLILLKDEGLRARLGVNSRHISLSSLFADDGRYKVEGLYRDAEGKHLRAVEELDEKAGILLGIISGELIIRDEEVKLPDWKVDLELLYNRIPLLKILFILLFSGGAIAGFQWIHRASCRDVFPGSRVAYAILWCAFVISLLNFIVEWILAARIPLSNMGETLNFTLLIGLGLMLCLNSRMQLSLGLLFWGCVALVSWMIGENPLVTPLMPALQSPWLSVHVTLVMVSYSLFGVIFVISFIGLCSRKAGERMESAAKTSLYAGVAFLAAGIATGSIWAKDAWGGYWSWDPKETWALITLILYFFPIIVRLRPRPLYLYLLFAFLSVLMTYFGVNYLLGGRHSYV